MKEIGGYIELDTYNGVMLHNDGLKLNCGRNALAHLIKLHNISVLWMPKYMCDSCDNILDMANVTVKYYHIDMKFKPIDIIRKTDEWIYIVNFYAQLDNEYISQFGENIIVDNSQAYFQEPLSNIDTIYTCRKFFGVPDGAIVYESLKSNNQYVQDVSYDKMEFLLGRFEKNANKFYSAYVNNNKRFENEPIKSMSKLTRNLLNVLDYTNIENKRSKNFDFVNEKLKDYNKLVVKCPKGPFMYPLYVNNGKIIQKKLIQKKIYIPTLWPAVFERCEKDELEYDMAENILPLPVDQRYNEDDMTYMISEVIKCID